jgi:hypothetical protein
VNGRHLRRHAVLIAAEIDDAVEPLVAAAAVATGNHTAIVAALAAVLGHH